MKWDIHLFAVVALTILSSGCFAVSFRVPRKYFALTTIVGLVGALCVRLAPEAIHPGYVSFFTAFLVGGISHVLARLYSQPAQIFLIPGVIFMVPGETLYKALRLGLADDFNAMFETFSYAAAVTFGICFGLLLSNWVIPSRREL